MEGLLEFKVLAILRKRENYVKYRDHIRIELFKSVELQVIYKVMSRFHNKYDHPVISNRELRLLVERAVPNDELPNYIPLLRGIRQSNTDDSAVIRDCIVKFAQAHAIRGVAQDLLHALENDADSLDLAEIRSRIDEALSLDHSTKEQALDFLEDGGDWISGDREPLILPTGLSRDLDEAIGGGLGGGEFGFLLAPIGRGKTLGLVNIGAAALRLGKRVLHVTLEIKKRTVGRRYGMCLTRSTFEDLRTDPSRWDKKLEQLKAKGARLLILDYTYTHGTIGDIGNVLERYQRQGSPFELLLVDYADLLQSPRGYKDRRHELSRLYSELRILAGSYDIPVWTASQTNRKALDSRVIHLRDIDEDLGKAKIADVIIAMCQTPEEREELMMRLVVCKQRASSLYPSVNMICDPDRMMLKAYKENDTYEGKQNGQGDDPSDRPRTFKNWDSVTQRIRGKDLSSKN
jgi:DnaB helicase-like protein